MIDESNNRCDQYDRIKFIKNAEHIDFFAKKYLGLYQEGLKILVDEYGYDKKSFGAKLCSAGYVQAHIIRDLMQSKINISEIKEEIEIIADCLLLCRRPIDIIASITQVDFEKLLWRNDALIDHLSKLHYLERCLFDVIADGTLDGIKIARAKWDLLRILD